MKRLLLAAFILSSVTAYSQAYKVNAKDAPIYNSNTAPFTKLATLKRGEEVHVLEKAGGVFKVKYKDQEGFMNRDLLIELGKYTDNPSESWHLAPLRKDNQILVSSSLSSKEVFKALHQYLIENNYNIEKAEADNLYITATAPLTKGIGSGQYRLNIFIKEEETANTYIQGTFDASVGGLTVSSMAVTGEIEYTSAKGSTLGYAFNSMDAAGKSIPNGKVQYRRKPKS